MKLILALLASTALGAHPMNFVELPGHTVKNDYSDPLPHTYVDVEAMPAKWDWGNMNGTSYLTHNLN